MNGDEDAEIRRRIKALVGDSKLIALRVRVCESVAAAVSSAAVYLHVPAALGENHDLRGLSMVVDMCADLASGAIVLFQSNRWYAGTALVRQLIETEYLLALFAQEPDSASIWLRASPAQLRATWLPNKMHKRLNGQFDHREYWDHCDRGGHPNPSAYPLLDGFFNDADRRFCWIDLAGHCKRIFDTLTRCLKTFSLTHHLERDVYAEAWAATEEWINCDPAPTVLRSLPRA